MWRSWDAEEHGSRGHVHTRNHALFTSPRRRASQSWVVPIIDYYRFTPIAVHQGFTVFRPQSDPLQLPGCRFDRQHLAPFEFNGTTQLWTRGSRSGKRAASSLTSSLSSYSISPSQLQPAPPHTGTTTIFGIAFRGAGSKESCGWRSTTSQEMTRGESRRTHSQNTSAYERVMFF